MGSKTIQEKWEGNRMLWLTTERKEGIKQSQEMNCQGHGILVLVAGTPNSETDQWLWTWLYCWLVRAQALTQMVTHTRYEPRLWYHYVTPRSQRYRDVMAVGRMEKSGEEGKEKKRKRKINKNNILFIFYWPNIRTAPNGAQKLQKIEHIILRRNMKTVCRHSIQFTN